MKTVAKKQTAATVPAKTTQTLRKRKPAIDASQIKSVIETYRKLRLVMLQDSTITLIDENNRPATGTIMWGPPEAFTLEQYADGLLDGVTIQTAAGAINTKSWKAGKQHGPMRIVRLFADEIEDREYRNGAEVSTTITTLSY